MDKAAKTNIIPGDHLKLYKLKKLGFVQEYLNPLLFNNNNESTVSE